MGVQMSRDIGQFLRTFFLAEGMKCADYPTLTMIRESPQGQHDFIWTFSQLADCHKIAEAYIIEAKDVEIEDESGAYWVDCLTVVLRKEDSRWSEPRTYFGLEEIYPGFDPQKLEERAKRAGEKTGMAIRAIAGLAEYP